MIDAIWFVFMHYFDRLSLKSTTICYKKILIIATHLATFLLCGFCFLRNFKKHALVDAFYHILHKNSIGHLLRTSQDYFRPPPKVLEKKWTIFIYIFEEYLLSLSFF